MQPHSPHFCIVRHVFVMRDFVVRPVTCSAHFCSGSARFCFNDCNDLFGPGSDSFMAHFTDVGYFLSVTLGSKFVIFISTYVLVIYDYICTKIFLGR